MTPRDQFNLPYSFGKNLVINTATNLIPGLGETQTWAGWATRTTAEWAIQTTLSTAVDVGIAGKPFGESLAMNAATYGFGNFLVGGAFRAVGSGLRAAASTKWGRAEWHCPLRPLMS